MENEIIYSSISNVPIRVSQASYNYRTPMPPHIVSSMHFHDEIELLRVESGLFSCCAAGKTYEAKSGDIIYIGSRVPHATETLTFDTHSSLIQFSLQNYSGAKLNANQSLYRFINNNEEPFHLFAANSEENIAINSYFDIICSETRGLAPGYEHFVTSGIHALIGKLYRCGILQDTESQLSNKYIDKIMPALHFIDLHYNDQITLEALSAEANINPSYFCRVFKKATDATFTEYLNFVRVLKSEQLLTDSAKSISDIALDVGFSSVSYFNRIFKRIKGISPTAYKKIKFTSDTLI